MDAYTFFCAKPCSKYGHLCTKPKGHSGPCSHYFLSNVIANIDTKIGRKLKTDTYCTPGNKGAAKNRADRCFPTQWTKKQIHEGTAAGFKGVCIPKRFSSTPLDCFKINVQLASQILAIKDIKYDISAFKKDELKVLQHVKGVSLKLYPDHLRCRICNDLVLKNDFYTAHASHHTNTAQLGHISPHINGPENTAHVSGNVQWIHRDCNIIQGDKTETETFDVLVKILINQGYKITKEVENYG